MARKNNDFDSTIDSHQIDNKRPIEYMNLIISYIAHHGIGVVGTSIDLSIHLTTLTSKNGNL